MQKYNDIEEVTEKKYTQRDKKKTPKMKVSGKGVFKLQELIRKAMRNKAKKRTLIKK